jgi:hypothetical protein
MAMLDERAIVIPGDPPWVAARPDVAAALHRGLVAAGFRA